MNIVNPIQKEYTKKDKQQYTDILDSVRLDWIKQEIKLKPAARGVYYHTATWWKNKQLC